MTNRTIQHDTLLRPEAAAAAAVAACVRGIVQRIDTVQRELTVFTQNGLLVIDVPVDCPVFLHGERVKLRLIQPGDHVNIRFAQDDQSSVAACVHVQPDATFACFRL